MKKNFTLHLNTASNAQALGTSDLWNGADRPSELTFFFATVIKHVFIKREKKKPPGTDTSFGAQAPSSKITEKIT